MQSEVQRNIDAPGPNLLLGTSRKNIIFFLFIQNQTIFELDDVIFSCINQVNSGREVTVNRYQCGQ